MTRNPLLSDRKGAEYCRGPRECGVHHNFPYTQIYCPLFFLLGMDQGNKIIILIISCHFPRQMPVKTRNILQEVLTTDVCEYLSFAESRLRKEIVTAMLPELVVLEKLDIFARSSDLLEQMQAHNKTVLRGKTLGLASNIQISSLMFYSVDEFVVRLNSSEVIKAIAAFCAFGRRIAPKVNQDQQALLWGVHDSLIITRDRWVAFCRRMARLALNIRNTLAEPVGPWPDSVLYQEAASELMALFGPYSGADDAADWMLRSSRSMLSGHKRQRLG